MVVQFSPSACKIEEMGGHRNTSVVLRPTLPQPDLNDVLELSVNGTITTLRLELGRYKLSYPLALIQLLITYHMITAGQAVVT